MPCDANMQVLVPHAPSNYLMILPLFLRPERASWAGAARHLMALIASVGGQRLATSPPEFDGSDGDVMGGVPLPPLATFNVRIYLLQR
jgi:hypothetical protein